MTRTLVSLACLTAVGCRDFPYALGDKPVCLTLDTDPVCEDIYGSTGTDATSSTGAPPSTSDASSSTSTTTGPAEPATASTDPDTTSEPDAPGWTLPLRAELEVLPNPALYVGPVQISLAVEGPAVAVDLYDGDTLLLEGVKPAALLHNLLVTSDDHPGDGLHPLRAVVHADDGRTVEARADLVIDVPAGGSQNWDHVLETSLSAYTCVAPVDHDLAVAGFVFNEDESSTTLAVARLDRAGGAVKSGPLLLDQIVWSGESRGPVVAPGPDGSVYLAANLLKGDATEPVLYRVDLDGPTPTLGWGGVPEPGNLGETVDAIAFTGEHILLAGAYRTHDDPPAYDLHVWWRRADGFLDNVATFAAPYEEDNLNLLSERAYGVTVADGDVVVVGTFDYDLDHIAETHVRTVVLRYSMEGDLLSEWTSPGDVLPEDAALAVTPRAAGGFAVTGWTREPKGIRQVLTRSFAPDGTPAWWRVEPTPEADAAGHAIAEDLEGKLIVAGTRASAAPSLDPDAWVFAVPGPIGPRTWEVIRDGTSGGPDAANSLTLDELGYVHVVGAELDDLEIHAFALRLFP